MSQGKIDILILHRENLLGTKTFEEYRDMHCAYIDMLIEQIEADQAKAASIKKWVVRTDVSGEKPE